ncbi:UNVERIFIED_CONTAM: hypothetical protein Slati_0151200 [Sesamum latifolium]|uniref:Retroviral polymerase SH3-like domain-containing protein n=1 Tax=Sesamum latifolium TaxID=2727402 RepID=A0AAW2YAH2_9LAMI
MLRMKEVYAIPDRHIRYATGKAFFGTKMAEGSSVQSHGVKLLSLVEKLEDLKARLDNDTYIDVIFQSLPPSYDPFIINYNMNGLEKSIHELINMLVQYEATTHNSTPTVLVGEASTSKAKGKRAECWKRKKGKGKAIIATASAEGAPAAPEGKDKGKGRLEVLSGRRQMMSACIAKERGIGRGSSLNSSPTQAAKLLNMEPSKTVPQTPYKIWHGKPAFYKYLRVWGSPAYVKRLVGDKLDSRSSLCRFIGYPKETAGYYFYDPSEQKIFISRNVVFLKNGFPADSRWDEVLLEESSEAPQQNDATLFEPTVPLMVFQSSIDQPKNLGHLRGMDS